jgi:hypothetical protein
LPDLSPKCTLTEPKHKTDDMTAFPRFPCAGNYSQRDTLGLPHRLQ